MHSDPNYARFVSYGNLAVKDFIVNNKLNILIHVEDVWSQSNEAYIDAPWFPYLKDNFLQWTTADSLPLLPQLKQQAEKCPNLWVWSSFAKRALDQENIQKYGHVKHVPGCLDSENFYPITKQEKLALRQKFNIAEDCFIFIQLGRNQLRKLFLRSLEAFKIFKTKYPQYSNKTKLYFHCNWSENAQGGQGWNLEKAIQDYGLTKEDVLTTYYCRNCGQWEIKPFVGEDQDCHACGTQKAQATAGVGSTVSDRDLSKIYGVCDGSLSIITSGGLEYTNVQSLLCKLPLLSTDYSCGEDFTKNDFVFSLDGTFTDEIQTGFKKHAPNLDTIVKFFKTVIELSPEERELITSKGRQWALETFDYKIIGKKLEEWLDSRKPHNWDFTTIAVKIANPNAVIENVTSDSDFIEQLYLKILNVGGSDPQGKEHWLNQLRSGLTREQMVQIFRNIATQDNQKNGVGGTNFEDLLDKDDKHRLLVTMPQSIGDVVLLTSTFESLRKRYPRPDWVFYVATNQENFEVLEANPFVDKVIPFIAVMDNLTWLEGQGGHPGYFDVAYLPHVGSQRVLTYLHRGIDKHDLEFKNI